MPLFPQILFPSSFSWKSIQTSETETEKKCQFSQGPDVRGCQRSRSKEPRLRSMLAGTAGQTWSEEGHLPAPSLHPSCPFTFTGIHFPCQDQVQPAFNKCCAQTTAFDGITDTVAVWDTPLKSLVGPQLCNLVVAHRKCWEPDSFGLCSRP